MEEYLKKTADEIAYWDGRVRDDVLPDIRKQQRETKVFFIWDDPRIETILRGDERRIMIHEVCHNKSGNVLEIGCGVGWLALELARAGLKVTGIDLSPKKISIARAYFEKVKKEEKITGNIEYFAGSIHDFDFSEATFDAVVAWDALHHIPNMSELVKKIWHWLKKGGKFIACEYMGSNPFNSLATMLIFMLPVVDKSKILQKVSGKIFKREETRKAPLEGVTRWEVIREVRNVFCNCAYETKIAFSYYVAPYLSRNGMINYEQVSFFKRLDDALIKLHFLRGEYVFIRAKKLRRRQNE